MTMIFILPSILSGFIFPAKPCRDLLHHRFGAAATYYIELERAIVLRGAAWPISGQHCILASMGLALFIGARSGSNKKRRAWLTFLNR